MRYGTILYYCQLWLQQFQACPSPNPGLCQALVTLSVLAVGNLSENLCPGVGHLSSLIESINFVPFSIVHLKIRVFR